MVKNKGRFFVFSIFSATTILFSLGAWLVGAVEVEIQDGINVLLSQMGLKPFAEVDSHVAFVLWEIRLPRILFCLAVGGGLALSGAALQGLFRNPLADPGLIGVSAGAALGAVISILWGDWFSFGWKFLQGYQLPVFGMVGGLLSTGIIYGLANIRGQISIATLLLSGIAINAFMAAMMGFCLFLADDQQLRTITFWTLGSLAHVTWFEVKLGMPFLVAVFLVIPFLGKPLNGLLLGEAEAFHMGVAVERIKKIVIILTAMAVGASVAVCGMIGFIGLVVPHLIRLSFGADNRVVLGGSIFLGGILLVTADTMARTIVAPAELPLGVITAMIGAPFFIFLLLKTRMI